MNPVAAASALASLVALAAAGLVAGFLRQEPVAIESLGDPLDDRRLALLRSLADLEEARDAGALDGAEYTRLREETEGRMASVLRALDRRERPGAAAEVAAVDAPGRVSSAEPRRVPPWAVAVLIGGTVLAMVVAALVRDTRPATEAATTPSTSSTDPLAFFEERVRDHPNDLAARLDLAHRYLNANMVDKALEQYAGALELDPNDAEAHAHVGMILYLAGRPKDALAAVDRSLRTDPSYPEALFFRGIILLRGLHRSDEAIDAFERYLAAAPFGAERETAQRLIAAAEGSTADGT